MNQLSDMIGGLEIGTYERVADGVLLTAAVADPRPTQLKAFGGLCLDDDALEYASATVAAGPTSMNAGCKNSVFSCINEQIAE
jgi:hypothetical protein